MAFILVSPVAPARPDLEADPPEIVSITPEDGPVAGGTPVTILGNEFTTTPDTTVTFGGVDATNIIVVDVNTITCDTPAQSAGSVDVVVTNSNGSDTLVDGFTYHGPPTLTSVSPDNGPIAGGTPVTLTGTDFTSVGTTTVTFDGIDATNIIVVDDTTITCDTPANPTPGLVDVTVTDDFGSDTLIDGFTYHDPPTLTSVSPENGPIAGGTPVTLTGTNFASVGTTTVTFDGIDATNIIVVDTTTITCDTPANSTPGLVDVTVTNDFGSDVLLDGFTYNTPPEIVSITPEDGPVAGGTPVTILGNEFTTTPDTTVTFGGVDATNIIVVDVNTITCDTPAQSAGSVDVVVTNSNGSDTLVDGFTYHGPPTLTSVSPENGPVAGGTQVTLTGTDFTTVGTTTVTFDGIDATNIAVVDNTTITCDTPANPAPGLVDVTVTNDFGSDTLIDGFTYHDPPTLTSVSPENGPIAGGTPVTLTGTNFASVGTTTVTFDGIDATNIIVVDTTTITCDTPANPTPGLVDVTVTNDFGSDVLLDGFTYNTPPEIVSITPEDGPVAGGTPVTILGNEFTTTPDTTVTFGGVDATNIIVVDVNTITCDTPAQSAGSVDVVVTNSNGSDTLVDGFTYHGPPTLTSVSPENGPVAGGTQVTLTGTDFTTVGTTTVTFDGIDATNIIVVDDTTITCDTPANPTPGLVDVTVTNDFGSDTLIDGFTYNTPPEIVSITPEDGPVAGGTPVTILGNEFTTTPDTTVTFGGVDATNIIVVDVNTITCDTPAQSAGSVDVVVINSNGSDTLVDGFTYHGPPTLTSVSPDNGPIAGGTPVTLTGTDFTTVGTTTVTFDGIDATNIAVVDNTTITCDTPANPTPGLVDVTVTDDFGSDTLIDGFTYHDPPTLTSVSPDNGPIAGGTPVTLTGTNFASVGTTTVTFDGIDATNIIVVDDTTITCDTPANPTPGLVDVTVTNDFGSDVLLDGFTYNTPPEIVSITPEDGPVAGGTPVTILGNEFTTTPDTTVTFGGVDATNIIVVDVNTITCDTPAQSAGSVDVVVTNSNGSDTLVDGFTYHGPPTLTSVSPENGPVAGGTPVTLTGTDFTTVGTTTVTFDGIDATNIIVVDNTTITCDTPANPTPGLVDVTVTDDFGSDTLENGFYYAGPVEIHDVYPDSGSTTGGTPITITGDQFTFDTTVAFDTLPASNITVIDLTTITCSTPAHAVGSVGVTVSNSAGSDTLPDAFTYLTPTPALYVPEEYATIQQAVNAAMNKDTILVAPGTYFENVRILFKSVTLRSDVDRDPVSFDIAPETTIIDGDFSGSVVDIEYNGITVTTLEGFTITHGDATLGAGVYGLNSSPIITRNIIEENTGDDGGGIGLFYSLGTISNNLIRDNSADSGGGVSIFSSSVMLTGNIITKNSSDNNGAGIRCDYVSNLDFTNCTITENTAGGNGGGFFCSSSSLTIQNAIFWNNAAPSGPEISIGSPLLGDPSTLTIHHSDVEGGIGGIFVNPEATLDWDATSMISTDPLFSDPEGGDFHLTWLSGCINRGINGGSAAKDFDGDPIPQMGTAEMGADEYTGILPLEADVFAIEESTGGTVNFILNGGDANTGRTYLILASVTGSVPGLSLPGGTVTLPVNWDIFTSLVISLLNSPVFSDFTGSLGPEGTTSAAFDTLGPLQGATGMTVTFAYALIKPWDFVSNPIQVEILP